jgi:predicted transcriptional regulator of viral defense system
VIANLAAAGVVTTVQITTRDPLLRPGHLVAIGLGVDASDLEPFELLAAHRPEGVVCFMSALTAHDLTTQRVVRHHVAVPKAARPHSGAQAERSAVAPSATDRKSATLGHCLFAYRGAEYYETHRESRYLTSTQKRPLHGEFHFRVTSLDQTLIDTLDRPVACGGAAVVFEAWESAQRRINPRRMAALLGVINHPHLSRRVVAMASEFGITVEVPIEPDLVPIDLIAGVGFTRVDEACGVRMP